MLGRKKGVDGPVFHAGSNPSSCGRCVFGTCPGMTYTLNSYYSCGGTGYYGCDSMNQTVGQAAMPCTVTFSSTAWALAQANYQACITGPSQNQPPGGCVAPDICNYTTCSDGTTGGTPIVRSVVSGLGDSGCYLAMITQPATRSVAELALTAVGHL